MRCRGVVPAALAAVVLVLPGLARAGDAPAPAGVPEAMQAMIAMQSNEKLPKVPKTLEGTLKAYQQGRAADAEAVLGPLAEKKIHDESYPLFLLSMGSLELSLGDYRKSAEVLQAAVTNLSAEIGTGGTALAITQSESHRPYRGYPHEKMLARTYLGLAYLQQGRYEDARIEFAKAREEHRGKAAGQNDDFVAGHFLEGLNALRSHRYNDAEVSFRRVTELQGKWPTGWYALTRACELAGDRAEAGESWSRYEALVPEGSRLARDGSQPCMLFLVESGWGPLRKGDDFLGQFGKWVPPKRDSLRVGLVAAGQGKVDAPSVDDLWFQANTTGGLAGEAGRKVVSAAVKGAMHQVPVLGLFAGKNEADERCWKASPALIHIALAPVPAEPTSVELTCTDLKGKAIAGQRQVFHYLRGQPFDQAPVVYARVLPNADDRELLHARK